MITVGMYIQKTSHAGGRSDGLDPEDGDTAPGMVEPGVPQRVLNLALLNRSCAPALLTHWESAVNKYSVPTRPATPEESSVRIVIGAGFVASGLNSLSSLMARLPGACKPQRGSVGFWTSFGSNGGSSSSRGGKGGGGKGEGGGAAAVEADEEEAAASGGGMSSSSRLPPEGTTRTRYLQSVGFLGSGGGRGGSGGCSVPWELSERYTNVGVRHYNPPSVCTALAIRHHFPAARVMMMLADPIRRAHAQQTLWLHNRCFRDAREALSASRGGKGRLAKGAAPGCERMDASAQLRLELQCVKGCKLSVDSSAEALQQCAATCGRVLRSALSCKSNCPYLSLINSHYALVLPLWMRSIPCEQLLLLERSQLFDAPTASGSTSSADGAASSDAADAALGSEGAPSPPLRRRARLKQASSKYPPPPPPRPPPPPPPPTMPSTPLLTMLRFVGVPVDNASHVATLQARYRLATPNMGITAANRLDARLQRELEAYFRPFQAQLRKQLASHKKCYSERTKALARKKSGMAAISLARAG